ncbi:hypothetical protein JJB07_06115 [Tumebacillus sp. ITR2]|uniref:Tail sheath protein Gp18-like domain-containing protein n=1 Tax=Tumebacillus amylolyticus TaxID=2801339 RepID=A0ABS1J7G7_9BACL|nr:hypothetical protein [Tumebacillus amylolyticus]MBL0386226.1 hypothetical protein [Tumebacillus amylolyticus]
MQFVNNLNNLILDDQYFLNVPVEDGSTATATGNIGLVGTFSRGPLNTPMLVTSYQDLVKKFGDVESNLTGAVAARGIFQQGNANVYVVRIAAASLTDGAATLTIKDDQGASILKLDAKTPGTWGDDILVTVAPGTKTGTYKLFVQVGTESELWDNLLLEEPTVPVAGGLLIESVLGEEGRSSLIKAEVLAATTGKLVNGTFALSQGDNGAVAVASDYIGTNTNGKKTGLQALDNSPINLVICAEQGDEAVNEALIENAESITANGGLPRMALLTFPRGTTVSMLQTLTQNLDSDRAISTYPWVNIAEVDGSTRVVSPLGYVAGVLAQLQPHLSMGNKSISGILGADPELILGPAELTQLVQSRVNPVGVQTPSGQLGIRSSLTLSQDQGNQQIYVRRMQDYINQLVSSVGGLFVDQPITDDLMRQVYHSVDNALRPLKSPINPAEQMIVDYKVVCDASNNPAQSIAQNRLICDYAVKLLNVNRFMIFRTQIGSGVVVTKQN